MIRRVSIPLRGIFLLSAIVFAPPAQASWFDWLWGSEDEKKEAAPADPAPSAPAPTTTPESAGISQAERRLMEIYQQEEAFFLELDRNPTAYPPRERDRRILEINRAYENFVVQNQRYVYGLILYGKFLRRIDDRERAHKYFMQAQRLDPEISVVYQQLAVFFAEEGEYKGAIASFLKAIELDPRIPVYHYQLGETLALYHRELIRDGIMTEEKYIKEMTGAFENAVRLEPSNLHYQWRYGESFFQLDDPDWDKALLHWQRLRRQTPLLHEKDLVRLQEARVLIAMGKTREARDLLDRIDRPALAAHQAELLDQLRRVTD